jgi:hypothetical protein
MNKSFYMEVDLGLMFVGVWCIIMDFVVTKLGDLRPGLRKKSNFYSNGSHRFRQGGYVVICIAIVVFISLLLMPSFDAFPSQGSLSMVADFFTKKTRVPWGQISVIGAIGFTAIAACLFWVGVQYWKLRGNYIILACCFTLGLVVLAEGIFQWQ